MTHTGGRNQLSDNKQSQRLALCVLDGISTHYIHIYQLQLGKHTVAVVQNTFTHTQYIEQHK